MPLPAPAPAALMDELVEQVFLRLPPDEPECLVRASLVCKPWRRILADAAFRRRYREFHGTPPLLGFLQNHVQFDGYFAVFVPTSGFRPAYLNHLDWLVLDCRHGRVLFVASNLLTEGTLDLLVWEPMTGDHRSLPRPWPSHYPEYTAAVLCAAEGCDHRGCQGGGPFRVAFVVTQQVNGVAVTSARLYSSETGAWSELTSVHHPGACVRRMPSVLVGDAIYFCDTTRYLIKYQLGTCRLSVFEAPTMCRVSMWEMQTMYNGVLMATEDGGLGFASRSMWEMQTMYNGVLMATEDGGLGFASVDGASLTLWSRETGTEGVERWAQCRVIDLQTLLPDDALWIPTVRYMRGSRIAASLCGYADGTQIIFVGTYVGVYMLELKSGRVREVVKLTVKSVDGRVFPYMSFHIQAMEAPPTGQGQ